MQSPNRPAVGLDLTEPEYSLASKQNCEQGTVGVRLHITTDGRVTDVKLAKSSGYSALDESVIAAAKAWRFSPAMRDGKPIETDTTRTVAFNLKPAVSSEQYAECARRLHL